MYASFNKGHCNLRNNEKTNIVGGINRSYHVLELFKIVTEMQRLHSLNQHLPCLHSKTNILGFLICQV